MIVCSECGNSAPSADGFCSSCGVLLEWSGEAVRSQPGPPVAVVQVPGSLPTALQAPVVEASTVPMPSNHMSVAPTPNIPMSNIPMPVVRTPMLRGPAIPAPEVVRPAPVPLVEDPGFDGLYCSACGARNAQGRSYCRLCGQGLDSAVALHPTASWWRRIFGRKAKVTEAGARPDGFNRREARVPTKRSRWRPRRLNLRGKLPLSKIAPLLIVLGLMGYGLGPGRLWVNQHLNTLIGKAKAHVSTTLVPVTPLSATASTSAPGHDPKLVIDGVKGTWWQSGDPHTAIGQSITVMFANPVDIDRIGLLSGAPDAGFRTTARVQTLAIAADGNAAKQVNFTDTADFQNAPTSFHGVRTLTIVIVSDFPGQSSPAAAIRELQFDRQQTGS